MITPLGTIIIDSRGVLNFNIVNLMTKILKNNTITLDDDVQTQYESLLDIIENRL